jgi:hypothetical protein
VRISGPLFPRKRPHICGAANWRCGAITGSSWHAVRDAMTPEAAASNRQYCGDLHRQPRMRGNPTSCGWRGSQTGSGRQLPGCFAVRGTQPALPPSVPFQVRYSARNAALRRRDKARLMRDPTTIHRPNDGGPADDAGQHCEGGVSSDAGKRSAGASRSIFLSQHSLNHPLPGGKRRREPIEH